MKITYQSENHMSNFKHGIPSSIYHIQNHTTKWQRYFLNLARVTSEMSKDPSTQVGAVIVRPNRTVAGLGYNGFAAKMRDKSEQLNDRSFKYDRMIHAEMNALLNSHDNDYQGYSIYVYPFMPCHRCFTMLVQAGITTYVSPIPTEDQLTRWRESFEKTLQFAQDCGVQIIEVPTNFNQDIKIVPMEEEI